MVKSTSQDLNKKSGDLKSSEDYPAKDNPKMDAGIAPRANNSKTSDQSQKSR